MLDSLRFVKYVRSFMDGRVRVRHPALRDAAIAGKARGLPGAYVALFKKIEELGGISAAVPALAGYTLSAREVQPIQTYLQENLGRNEALVRQIGCVIGTHAGPGAFGLAFLDEGFTF